MGYIRDMWGDQNADFITGFLAAMHTYAVWYHGKQHIGSPEKELKNAMIDAVCELCTHPEDFHDDIDKYF